MVLPLIKCGGAHAMTRRTLTGGLCAAALVGALMSIGYGALAQATKSTACKGLEESACKAKSECQWIKASVDKSGKVKRKAYCRTKVTRAKKAKEPAKK
jgi:hypothetical protein